jgi:hypothetical protein
MQFFFGNLSLTSLYFNYSTLDLLNSYDHCSNGTKLKQNRDVLSVRLSVRIDFDAY